MSTESTFEKSTANASDLISTLRLRAPRIAMALAAGQVAWPVARNLRAKALEHIYQRINLLVMAIRNRQ